MLRYSNGDPSGYSVTGMAYKGEWDATDQIPERAVRAGQIDRFDTLDPTTGGMSQRYSLSAEAHHDGGDAFTQIAAYTYYYDLDLYSNFTYFLNDPVNGDQFLQSDRRIVSGLRASHALDHDLFGRESKSTLGLQFRHDAIDDVGLFNTTARRVRETVRRDEVMESALGLYVENRTQWAEKFRTVLGARGDFYYFDVDVQDGPPENAGSEKAAIFSPKGSLIFGPWADTELYLSGGLGFHSNDARGVLTQVDPASGEFVSEADPLVRTKGAEVGVRGRWPCRGCRARWRCGCWNWTRSWCSSATPARPTSAGRAAATASSGPTTTRPPRCRG